MDHLQLFEAYLATDKNLFKQIEKTIEELANFKKPLFLTTSSRWSGDKETPKSSLIASYILKNIPQAAIIDVSKLNIATCEGNVSRLEGNNCGVKESLLKSKMKNPSNQHRCWASLNHTDDELWKITKELFESDCVIFFASVRWGQLNSVYQKLIERLTWLENRHSTFNEKNILKDITSGLIIVGQNWKGSDILKTQSQVLSYFGFKKNKNLEWNFQYTTDSNDESLKSYKAAGEIFKDL
jgi:multimeric flavodoxin WrbA